MLRDELERENDIEELRRVAVALHVANNQLIAQLRAKCKALAKLTGNSAELQQTLALINTLTAKQREAPQQPPPSPDDSSLVSPEPAPAPPPRSKPDRTGPTPQPSLPVVAKIFKLDDADQACTACGKALRPWTGQFEASEMIEVIEARYQVVEVKRQKYLCECKSCIETALGPERASPGSRYSLDLALKVVVDKYMHSLPLNRQVAICAQLGFVTSSSTLWELVYQIGQRLAPVSEALLAYALQQNIIGIDQTNWPRLDDASGKPWQMWAVTVSGVGTFAVAAHRIADDKGAATMTALIGEFRGTIVCDQAATHGAVAHADASAIELAGCWAHIIRRFKAASDDFPAAQTAVDLIRALYDIDATLDEREALLHGLPLHHPRVVDFFACRAALRDMASREVCARLLHWLQQNRGPTVLSIHDAVEHTLKYWQRLTRFLDNPRIPLDNNATERAFRGPVVGRKNYYGAKSRSGTQVAATIFTLIETCKLHRVPVVGYLRAACLAANAGRVLLPWEFAAAGNNTTATA